MGTTFYDLDMGPLTLDDPETGEPLVDQETGEFQVECSRENLRVIDSCVHLDPETGAPALHAELDPETGEAIGPECFQRKAAFKIPGSLVACKASFGTPSMEVFQAKDEFSVTGHIQQMTREVVVPSEGCRQFGVKRPRCDSLTNENGGTIKATLVHKKMAVDNSAQGTPCQRFLQSKTWPKVLIVLGLIILTPGFAVPLVLMARLYTHYKKHFLVNPNLALDENELLPCGLRRKEVPKYAILFTLLHMCRFCREEYAGEKFARLHSKLHPAVPRNPAVHGHRPGLGGANHITCCG